MGGAFSYASFSRSNGRTGGWGVGSKAGDITREELSELISYVPTTLNNGKTIPDFPSDQQRAELVRRTAVFALTPEADKWVTMVSVPAGLDATGRGGNVFTYTAITRTGTPPAPSAVLYSPDIPTPFSIYEVDKVQIPAEIKARGPLTSDVLLDEFLDGEFRQPDRLPPAFRSVTPNPDSAFNRELVSAMATVLDSSNGFVILVAPDNQAALWIAATAREAGDDGFGFSTFERAAAVNEFPLSTSTMIVVPPSEKGRLADTAISGNPMVFALDEAIPDVSGFQRSSAEEAPETAAQDAQVEHGAEPEHDSHESHNSAENSAAAHNVWAEDASPFGAPVSGNSPFAAAPASSTELPTGPTEKANEGTIGMPVSAAHDNPFADPSPVQPAAEESPAPEHTDAAQDSPFASFPASTPEGEDKGADQYAEPSEQQVPSAACNAVVPGLSNDEWQMLTDFDPHWWAEYLDTHRGRSIQLAYLDKSSLEGGLDKRLMSAVVASWVYYFPPEYSLLAADALDQWQPADIEQIINLTATGFAMTIRNDPRNRHAGERVARVLDAVGYKLDEFTQHQQQQNIPPQPTAGQAPPTAPNQFTEPGRQHSGFGHFGRGRGNGFHGR